MADRKCQMSCLS